jgi:predicted MFS family arabinose efflux permease
LSPSQLGATTLLTETYRPHEKGKVQALHDFVMFSAVALATYFSGQTFHRFDWEFLNHLSWPLVLITSLIVVGLQYRRRSRTWVGSASTFRERKMKMEG